MAETAVSDDLINALVFETFGIRRFVHDSPIRPDVWIRYIKLALRGESEGRVSLILTPKRTRTVDQQTPGGAGALANILEQRMNGGKGPARIAATSRYVVADLTFTDVLGHVLPLTSWWQAQPDSLKNPKDLFAFLWENTESAGQPARNALAKIGNVDLMRFVALTAAIGIIGPTVESHARFVDIARLLTIPTPAADEDDNPDDIMGSRPMRRQETPVAGAQKTFANATVKDLQGLQELFAERMNTALGEKTRKRIEISVLTSRSLATIWSVERNRNAVQMAQTSQAAEYTRDRAPVLDGVEMSRDTVKADAAIRLFSLSGRQINWAVIDSGIDSTHRAFADWAETDSTKRRSRVVMTLDFTRLRDIQSGDVDINAVAARLPEASGPGGMVKLQKTFDSLERRRLGGRDIDWALLEPLLKVNVKPRGSGSTDPDDETIPNDSHGTHVAGIIGGWSPPVVDAPAGTTPDEPFYGVCPDIRLFDLRVFTAGGLNPGNGELSEDRGGDEFTILAALDYVAWLNRDPQTPIVHGVNLSLSMRHDVKAHACGNTPVCEAANRLSATGTVVVAAAGNAGFDPSAQKAGIGFGYRGMSITDPGNAAGVICVGATHSRDPHTYGVSFFSSRGPTGDGRLKPDLVAPGEKIRSALPQDLYGIKDGTSMAAPHVSGVCALLMARHKELIGNPARIKEVLMRSAVDLGRERYFQGAGLVDALRALQSL
jgi:serine protease AprX